MPDVLLVNCPDFSEQLWEEEFLGVNCPRVLLIWEEPRQVFAKRSEGYRARCKRLETHGYAHILKHLRGPSCGSPVWSNYLSTVYYQSDHPVSEQVLFQALGEHQQHPRGVANCLLYAEIPQWTWARVPPSTLAPTEEGTHFNHVGWCNGLPVYSEEGPAPSQPCYIQTRRGVRRLTVEEWRKIKGYPTEWRPGSKLLETIRTLPGAHEWNAVGDYILQFLDEDRRRMSRTFCPPPTLPQEEVTEAEIPPWIWTPPLLGPGTRFYQGSRQRLLHAIQERHGPST